jgi:hypothetical protein
MLLPTHPLPPVVALCIDLSFWLLLFCSLFTVIDFLAWLTDGKPIVIPKEIFDEAPPPG